VQIIPESEGIDRACDVLLSGIVAHATETCYGLACDLTNQKSVQKLFALKKRPENLPVSALFASIEQAKEYVEWNASAEELSKHLPGPITLILPLKSDAKHKLYPTPSGGETIGIRISSHPTASALVESMKKPLSTTSANLHGDPEPNSAENVVSGPDLDLILDGGILSGEEASTVVNLTGETPEIVRQGALEI
jgi:L-threonylcarbamoyladenylate synthase